MIYNNLTAFNCLIEEFLDKKDVELIPIIEGISKNIINELKTKAKGGK